MLRMLLALVLLAHGIGHSLSLLQVFKISVVNPSWNGDSWLLSGVIGTGAAQWIGVLLWGLSLLGFAGVAAAVVGWLPATWFTPLAIGAAAASLAGIALFPIAFPFVSTIAAVAVDVAVLVAVLALRWEPSALTV